MRFCIQCAQKIKGRHKGRSLLCDECKLKEYKKYKNRILNQYDQKKKPIQKIRKHPNMERG